jgi:hypothetical protein
MTKILGKKLQHAMLQSAESELSAMWYSAESQYICNMKPDPVPDLDPVKNRPEPQHWSKPVSDPDPTPQITDLAKSIGYLQIQKLFQVSNDKYVATLRYAA